MSDRPERWRLFVAADVPEDVLDDLASAIEPHRDSLPGARWAPPANQHVTLKFLGSVELPLVSRVTDRCRELAGRADAGELTVAGVDAFPNRRRARVLWAGIEDPAELLRGLAARLDAALSPLGLEPEKRAFTPHLTLARLKAPTDVGSVAAATDFRSETFRLEEFHLYRSRLSPKGARYEVLDSFVLGGGARRNP